MLNGSPASVTRVVVTTILEWFWREISREWGRIEPPGILVPTHRDHHPVHQQNTVANPPFHSDANWFEILINSKSVKISLRMTVRY